MRRVRMVTLAILLLILGGGWLWYGNEEWRDSLLSYVENREMVTLEPRFSAEEVLKFSHDMESQGKRHPVLKYFPFLLLDVKYAQEGKTKESSILWSLVDGEMVLDTYSWETTHGFQDCIRAKACRNDFLLLYTLSRYPHGRASIDQLRKDLQFEKAVFNQSVARTIQKHLVVQLGPALQLHFENPKMFVSPRTVFPSSFVTKPYNYEMKMAKQFSHRQIQQIAQAAFGDHFAIRNKVEVYVPVYVIETRRPDGSVSASYWNAYNGQPLQTRVF